MKVGPLEIESDPLVEFVLIAICTELTALVGKSAAPQDEAFHRLGFGVGAALVLCTVMPGAAASISEARRRAMDAYQTGMLAGFKDTGARLNETIIKASGGRQ